MAKQEIFANRIAGPLMRGMHHIPVDRDAGLASYKAALAALKPGEVVGVFPEATISQSFTVKEIKSGAARMAAAAGVPLIPMALWGTQRLWTKGRPRSLIQRHVPVSILVGEPMHAEQARQRRRRSSCTDGCRSCWTGHSRSTRTNLRARRTLVAARPPRRHRSRPRTR